MTAAGSGTMDCEEALDLLDDRAHLGIAPAVVHFRLVQSGPKYDGAAGDARIEKSTHVDVENHAHVFALSAGIEVFVQSADGLVNFRRKASPVLKLITRASATTELCQRILQLLILPFH
jgi:hypothetical protein